MRNVRLGLHAPISQSKPPVIEYDVKTEQWRVWTAYDTRLEHGTYISLLPNGGLRRICVAPDGSIDTTPL